MTIYLLLLESFDLGNGSGDVSYNSRRNILGVVANSEEMAHYLFKIGSNTLKVDELAKLCRKAKRYSQHSKLLHINSQLFH